MSLDRRLNRALNSGYRRASSKPFGVSADVAVTRLAGSGVITGFLLQDLRADTPSGRHSSRWPISTDDGETKVESIASTRRDPCRPWPAALSGCSAAPAVPRR